MATQYDSVNNTLSQENTQASPIDRVLSLLPGYRSYARGYTAHCPAHNDGHDSLMIWEDEDGHAGIKCHAGCSRKAVCYALGMPETDLYVKSKNHKPRFQKHSLDIMAFALVKGIHPHHLTNWGVIEGHNFRGWKNILRIAYYNLDGSEYSKYRIRTGLKGDVFLWEGNGPIIPYGLDRLSSTKEYIVFPEGESCTWTLWQWGFNALGIPGVEQVKSLQSEHVALLPPTVYLIQEPPSGPGKPEAGKKFVANMAARLNELGYQGKVLIIDLNASHDVKDANELNQKLMNEGRIQDFKKEFQQAIEQALSINDTDLSEQMRPDFIIEGQLRTQVKRAIEVLKIKNEQDTRLFVYLSTISKVEYDEKGDPMIIQLEKAALRNELSDAADFKVWKKDHYADAHPPKDLAEQLLALAPRKWGLPPLKAIVEAPVLRPDGSILNERGYDEKTGLYYVPSPGMDRCVIPETPSQQDAIEAMSRIKALFADFPFEGQADYANTIGLLFTPFVRYAVKKDIQMALIDATNPGTGKGLISIVVSIIATGRKVTPMSAKRDDEEWRKAIFAELLRAPRIVIIDNIKVGTTLESATLDLMLTGNGLNERILGHSKSASPKNEATWMATGNNLMIGGDLPRRCYRIRLISKTATPEERDDFAIKDLEQHTLDTRPQYVSDVLTVARAWHVAGKPQPIGVPNLGTFTDWCKTIGGMLEFAGVEGFQSNRDELRSRNNEVGQQWEAFLSALHDKYGSAWNTAGTFAKEIKDQSEKAKENSDSQQTPATPLFDSLPLELKKSLAEKPKSFSTTLANQLAARVQTVYGSDGFRIEKDWDSHLKQATWRVMRVFAGVTPPHSQSEENAESPKTEDSAKSSESANTENINDRVEHPQTPANVKKISSSDTPKTVLDGSTSGSRTETEQIVSTPVAGVVKEVAGVHSEQSTQYPDEYMTLFTDYKNKVRNNPVDSLMWMAPDQRYTNQMKEKEKHIQFTKELLCSGVDRRVRAAVEAMKRTLDIWED